MKEKLTIRPYARLLTMLGDQLIKNEQIAIIELIKNAYDADADWVTLSFQNFNSNYGATKDSLIVIEDNGEGMTKEIIEKAWMSPATPNKYSKDGTIRRTKIKKRIIQGEKGIGRYAMLKLGHRISMTTRPENGKEEYTINLDFSEYGEDYYQDGPAPHNLYLDELSFDLQPSLPSAFVNRDILIDNQKFSGECNEHGTKIVISDLQGAWNKKKIESITNCFIEFGDLFGEVIAEEKQQDFLIGIFVNGERYISSTKGRENTTLANLFETQSVFKITNGIFDQDKKILKYNQNGIDKVLTIDSSEIRGIRIFKEQFWDKDNNSYRDVSAFGNFEFDFYVFDFNAKEPSKYSLTEDAKKILKAHRIYLLRDGIRVLPYGDADDDWLQIDVGRGTISAGAFFSNDQVVGRIKISKFGNPHLKDKTNREGLIDEDHYTSDFICIIRTFLSYLRTKVYKSYLEDQKKKNAIDKIKRQEVDKEIKNLKEYFKDDHNALNLVSQLEKVYHIEYKYLENRANQTESLAAVGLSVETTSHDMMMMMDKGIESLMLLMNSSTLPNFSRENLTSELQKLLGIFSYVMNQMKDMQMLFTSSKQRRRQIRVNDILEKVLTIYKRTLLKYNINYDINPIGSPLIAKCTDADLLQLFINLIDNAIYWLNVKGGSGKEILITLDGKKGQMIFSDNGVGVKEDDAPFIFEPFYSGKGDDGRGLGLYISRKLMERNDYSIELVDLNSDRLLSGANFIVSFVKQVENEY